MAFRAVYRERGPTAAELNAQLEREWARHQAAAEAKAAAERNAEDVRLEITAVDLYHQLGKAIGGITTEQSWLDLAGQVESLVAGKALSSRHGDELHARLLRVARDRRWVTD